MQRDSFIFYRSFYEAINDLPDKEQLKVYKAICEMSLNFEEIDLKGLSNTIFKLIKPQLEANNTRYKNGLKGKEFGILGGRPKKPQEKPQENPKLTPNNNVNENENVNDNVNVNDADNIYTYIEQNFGRNLSPLEISAVSEWKDNELTRYAIKKTILSGIYNLSYINSILNSYKQNNITTVQQAQQDEKKFRETKIKHNYKQKQTPEDIDRMFDNWEIKDD